jgi:hypothetical protein
MPNMPPFPNRNRLQQLRTPPVAPPRPTPTRTLVPQRNGQGFTEEEAAKVEARAQELYGAMRAADIEAAAQGRAAQLYKALIGVSTTQANLDAAIGKEPQPEAAVAAPDAG